MIMKVLLVNKFHFRKGGSETYYFTLAELLKKKGHEVIYFSIDDERNLECDDSKYFIKNAGLTGGIVGKFRMLKNMNYSKEAYENIKKEINAEKPDLAILNLVHKQISLSIVDALKENNVPIFWTVHDLIFVCPSYTMLDGNGHICEKCLNGDFANCLKNKCIHGSTLYSLLSYREAKFIKKHKFYDDIDCFICPSEFYKQKLQSSNLINSNVVYLPNPCLNAPVSEVNKNPKDYLLYFGRLSKEKGVDLLLNSICDKNINLVIAGDGPMKSELILLCDKLNLTNKVKFVGFKQGEELTSLIKESKFVILPSQWYENGPYSAIEALSFGKPLIVSSFGGLPELIDGNGFIFKNSSELDEILNKIISISEEEYVNLCLNSLNKYKSTYYNFDYVQAIVNLYEEVKSK